MDLPPIDLHNLHVEWVRHSSTYDKYEEMQHRSQIKKDNAKDLFDRIRAKLFIDIRENPSKYGLKDDKRITEATIDAVILTNAEYQTALKDLRMFEHQLDEVKSNIRCLDNRKKALENEGSLYVSKYWSSPSVERILNKGKDNGMDLSEIEYDENLKNNLEAIKEVLNGECKDEDLPVAEDLQKEIPNPSENQPRKRRRKI